MNAMQVFNYEGNKVRTVMKDGEPWWVLRDACQALGIAKHRDMAARLDADERASTKMDTPGGAQNITIINESGLYHLIFHSNKPDANRFRRWVTHEVLPAIRKTGSYGQPDLTAIIMQTATAVCAEMVKQLTPLFQSLIHPTPARRVAWGRDWNSNSNPGPRKDIVTRPPTAKGTLRIETFPPDIVCAVDSMMEQMMEEQALNFSEIARYCTGQGYMISSPSVRRYYDKHFNRH